jgi:hypothetical protein
LLGAVETENDEGRGVEVWVATGDNNGGDDGGTVTLSSVGSEVLVGAGETEGDAVASSPSKTEGDGVAVGVEEEDGETDRDNDGPSVLYAEGLDATVGFREDEGATVVSSLTSDGSIVAGDATVG